MRRPARPGAAGARAALVGVCVGIFLASSLVFGQTTPGASSGGGSGTAVYVVRKPELQVFSTAAFADVTGLSWSVAANTTYVFSCRVSYLTSATTESARLAVNGPASPTSLLYSAYNASSSGLNASASVSTRTAYDSSPAFTSGPGSTAVVSILDGIIATGENAGTFTVRAHSETGDPNTTTVGADSYCTYFTPATP
jgi:hypothetical protein